MIIDREEFLQEQKLRGFVRDAIRIVQKRKAKNLLEEKKLRSLVRTLIAEEGPLPEEETWSTGVKELSTLLKKIIPQLEDDFKILTTDPEQRKSFRAHIIHAIQNTLSTVLPVGTPAPSKEEPLQEASINVDIEEEEPDASKMIDLDGDGVPDDEEPEEVKFGAGLEGHDLTGRNIALRSYKKVEQSIIDSYKLLANDEDRSEFYDYLITNVKLHFDAFEDNIAKRLGEPTTDQYKKEKEEKAARTSTPDLEPTAVDPETLEEPEDPEELDLGL